MLDLTQGSSEFTQQEHLCSITPVYFKQFQETKKAGIINMKWASYGKKSFQINKIRSGLQKVFSFLKDHKTNQDRRNSSSGLEPVNARAVGSAWQCSGVEAGSPTCLRWTAMDVDGTWIVLLDAQRLVRAADGRTWDGEDERRWLDCHHRWRTREGAVVRHVGASRHFGVQEQICEQRETPSCVMGNAQWGSDLLRCMMYVPNMCN